jgi:hypothetical protein
MKGKSSLIHATLLVALILIKTIILIIQLHSNLYNWVLPYSKTYNTIVVQIQIYLFHGLIQVWNKSILHTYYKTDKTDLHR